uniref:Uncharacterized protein n=1 Tax=Oryza barthii TaxID=65489 RepID=A0A0D3HQT7_9ORYZ
MTNELKRCSTPSEEKEAKRMKKEEAVKKKRMPMERVQHLLSMVPRAPVPLPVIRDDSPELKEIDQALANVNYNSIQARKKVRQEEIPETVATIFKFTGFGVLLMLDFLLN